MPPSLELMEFSLSRPRKWFVVFRHGSVAAIVEGQKAAHRIKRDSFAAYSTFTTRHAAEEFAAWHSYMLWSRLVTPAYRAKLTGTQT